MKVYKPHPYCEGCTTYSLYDAETDETFWCEFSDDNYNKECPCIDCLIKTICRDACETMDNWVELLKNKKRKENDHA